ncbi:hypothetical protein NQ318_020744, partial [Aromia moschata]
YNLLTADTQKDPKVSGIEVSVILGGKMKQIIQTYYSYSTVLRVSIPVPRSETSGLGDRDLASSGFVTLLPNNIEMLFIHIPGDNEIVIQGVIQLSLKLKICKSARVTVFWKDILSAKLDHPEFRQLVQNAMSRKYGEVSLPAETTLKGEATPFGSPIWPSFSILKETY